ncbi:MAG: c-type cytochrome [Myxococcota bacterium]
MKACLRTATAALAGCLLLLGCNAPPRLAHFPTSSTITSTPLDEILVLDTEHDDLVILHRVTGNRQTVALGGTPGQMTLNGPNAVITLPYDRSIVAVALPTRTVMSRIPVGVEPQGVVSLDATTVAVVLAGEGALVTVDLPSGNTLRRHELNLAWPHGIAASGSDAVLVTDRVRPEAVRLDLTTSTVDKLQLEGEAGLTGSPMVPSLMHSVTAVPSRNEFLIPHINLARSGDGRMGFVTSSGPVANVYYGPKPQPTVGVETVGPVATPKSWPLLQTTTDSEPLSEPVATALLDGEAATAVLFRGSRRLVIWGRSAFGGAPCETPFATARVGHGADGLALTPDGNHMLIRNASDLTVSVIEVPNLRPEGSCIVFNTADLKVTTLSYAATTLSNDAQRGRRMFYDGTNMDMTRVGITCAYCHVDGRTDNRLWEAPKGTRNTPSLAGATLDHAGIADTAPFHWDGEFATFGDMSTTVTQVMVGDGINGEEGRQLFAFIDTLRKPDHVMPNDDETAAQVARGKEIFHDPAVGCAACHAGAHGTDNLNHDVGTGPQFQTPVLDGLSRTAPYLHDGSMETLDDVVTRLVITNKMGQGSHLSRADQLALIAYLRTL